MSRADLWAFAGIVAVQRGIDNNNAFCGNFQKYSEYVDDYTCNDRKDCSINENIELIFKTGRSDCAATDQ